MGDAVTIPLVVKLVPKRVAISASRRASERALRRTPGCANIWVLRCATNHVEETDNGWWRTFGREPHEELLIPVEEF